MMCFEFSDRRDDQGSNVHVIVYPGLVSIENSGNRRRQVLRALITEIRLHRPIQYL